MVSSEFISKIEFACKKKESLYGQSKFKYAIRAMFAGAFLTFSTAAGAVGADLINKIAPGSGRFLFPFVFAWGLAYICLLYTSDAADEGLGVDLGGRRIIKKKK